MHTIEQALLEIEDIVGGSYRTAFTNSELRKNPEEQIEFLKFNLETIAKAKKTDVKIAALKTVINIVLDDTEIPDTWRTTADNRTFKDYNMNKLAEHRLVKWPHDAERAIAACDEVIARLAENSKEEDGMSVKELSDKYKNKWLYFNGDEDGCQWVYVKNIHRDKKTPVLCVDGVMVDYDGQDSTFRIYGIENKNFSDFYYFGCEGEDDENYDGYVFCSSLDKALMSRPCDTSMPNHIISAKSVVDDILSLFAWEFEDGYDTQVPGMAELFNDRKYENDD